MGIKHICECGCGGETRLRKGSKVIRILDMSIAITAIGLETDVRQE